MIDEPREPAAAPRVLGEWSFPCALAVVDARHTLRAEGATGTEFEFASVTKLLTSYAALIAVDRHMLDLDAPAGAPAPAGTTIRHLLAHAAGLPFERGYPAQRPERHRVYSNYGMEILGARLSEAVGVDIHEWVEEQVLIPLGVVDLSFYGSPAYGARGTVGALADLVREWLAPTLVSPELFSAATTVQFPGLDGVLPSFGRQRHNDWGLGFEIRSDKSPHWMSPLSSPSTFGHFGRTGSFAWVDPVAGIGAAFLGAEPFGDPHLANWADLNTRIARRYAISTTTGT